MTRTVFDVRVEQDGRTWLIVVDGVGTTQARNLAGVEVMARDLVEMVRELDRQAFDLRTVVVLPDEVKALRDQARSRQDDADAAQVEASRLLRAAVRQLLLAGHTQRDVGVMLGLSHQRVGQLAEPSLRRRSA